MVWQANLYNDKHSFVYDYGAQVIDLLGPQAQETILDIGCGSGELTSEIAASCHQAIGMDSSAQMIQKAKSSFADAHNLDFIQADAVDFDLPQQFDAVFSNAALHWVTEYQAALARIYKHLKDGGRFVAEFGGHGNIATIENSLRRQLNEFGYTHQATNPVWYFPTVGQYAGALEDAGFEVRFAQLFDRPTKLADRDAGIVDWLSMFGFVFFEGVTPQDCEAIKQRVQSDIKETCFYDDAWYADYRRLRVVAVK